MQRSVFLSFVEETEFFYESISLCMCKVATVPSKKIMQDFPFLKCIFSLGLIEMEAGRELTACSSRVWCGLIDIRR